MPRYYKIQEFQAHLPTVTCASIGRKSMGVIVTGGDDKLVNLWTIGRETRTLSLTGHQSSVESVAFDSNEEVVAAGSASGAIKVFDLDAAQVTRSLSGHKCHVRCLDFTKDHLVSGSNDTNVKVWDLRIRNPAMTCKAHGAPVLRVRLSPEGRWVASGDQEGQVKIFDLTAGRVIQEYSQHTHPITGLEFHPNEYLMATASADKTVKVWDLEMASLLESTPLEATGVRAMTFHPDGRYIFAAMQDGLRVWQWEPSPAYQHDNVDIPWTKVHDIAMMPDQRKVIGCSFSTAFVGLWVVDLQQRTPEGSQADTAIANYQRQMAAELERLKQHQQEEELRRAKARADAEGRAGIVRTSPAYIDASSAPAPQLAGWDRGGRMVPPPIPPRGLSPQGAGAAAVGWLPGPQPGRISDGEAAAKQPQRPELVSIGVGVGDSLARGAALDAQEAQQLPASSQPPPAAHAAPHSKQHQRPSAVGAGPLAGLPSEGDQLSEALRSSDAALALIGARGSVLATMRTLLRKGDLRGALTAGRRAADAVPAADVLSMLMSRRGFGDMLGLDAVPDLVAVLEAVLTLPAENHRMVALDMGLLACKSFGPTIREVCGVTPDKRLGVDMAFEQRRNKCEAARLVLQGLQGKLGIVKRQSAGGSGALALRINELSDQLAQL